MDDITIARALHVISVVLWIGGVGFVTTVLLPAVRHFKEPKCQLEFFDRIERRFARASRFLVTIVGVTGFYMLARFDLWDRFRYPAYWWIDAMIAVWLLFTLMLFVVEPLFLRRWLLAQTQSKPELTFELVERLHRILLLISLITILGTVAGSHGLLLFE
jgi:uncharacterized membrane protein